MSKETLEFLDFLMLATENQFAGNFDLSLR